MDGVTVITEEYARELKNDIRTLVGEVAPEKEMAVGGPYEGADEFDRWLAAWMPGLGSADSDLIPIKSIADARSRDAHRNDGYVQRGSAIAKDSIVGGMYMVNHKPNAKALGVDDEVWEEEIQEEVEAKFTLAAESYDCWFDAARQLTFTGIIRLAVGMMGYGGEYLGTVAWLRDSTRPFRTAIQSIELDRLVTPYTGIDGRIIRGGVHQDERGAPIGYYIRKGHLMDFDRFLSADDFTYVPVRKPWGRLQVVHLKDTLRPNQTRAVADIVAGLKEIQITKKFRHLTLQQAVIQAMFAASIESDLPPAEAYAALGGEAGSPDFGLVAAKYGMQYLKAIAKYHGKKGIRVDDVKIPHFFPGTRMNLKNVGAPGGVGMEFEQSLLRYIAALLGVSYEELSKDFSKTNYSSARAGLTETWKTMQSKKKMFADRLASIIFSLWFEEMMNAGQIEAMKYSKLPNFYDGLNREAYTAAEWIGASRGQIDELKETQAAVLRIKFGLSTHEEELAKLGKDWRRVYRQLERERKEREARGIILQEDNSVNAASGSPRDDNSDSGANDTGADQNV